PQLSISIVDSTAPAELYTLSLHDALPIWMALEEAHAAAQAGEVPVGAILVIDDQVVARASNRTITDCDPSAHAEIVRFEARATTDRKSTRLNSSHGSISYAVFCLKTKTKQ